MPNSNIMDSLNYLKNKVYKNVVLIKIIKNKGRNVADKSSITKMNNYEFKELF